MTGRIVIIGAAGDMVGVAVRRLARYEPDLELVLADVNTNKLDALVADLPPARASAVRLDLFDAGALRAAIDGADLVMLAAGPFMRTAAPVIDACLDAGVDYLDFDDDNASTLHSLDQNERARVAGVAVYIGAGASPGISNVMAVDVASQVDGLEDLDVAWCSGDEGPQPYAPAIIEHLMHACAGPIETWRSGAMTTVEAFAESAVFPMGGELGDYRLYEVGHPEAITLGRRYPEARRIRCLGGFHPQPVNGLFHGVAEAVHSGRLDMADAVTFFQSILADGNGTLAGWRAGWSGMRGQVKTGEVGAGALLAFLVSAVRGRHPHYVGGILARATGTSGGQHVTVTKRLFAHTLEPGGWNSMAAVTGAGTAAFTALALRDRGRRAGVFSPEDWVAPDDLYAQLAAHGTPKELVVEPGYHRDLDSA